MEVSIRRANIEDYDGMCETLREVHELHCKSEPEFFQMPENGSTLQSREYITELIESDDSNILLAEAEDCIVGVAIIHIRNSPDHPAIVQRQLGVIESLSVLSSYRGRGIGTKLMEAAEKWVADKGVSSCELVVWEFNRDAIKLYERLGYSTVNRRMYKSME